MRDEIANGKKPPLGVGIIGWGGIARVHMLALKSLPVLFPDLPFNVRLAAVATRDPARAGDDARNAGFEHVMSSPAELAGDAQVDVVDICTPNALHPQQAADAWRNGKAVYVEKPLAESMESAQRLGEAWRAAGSPDTDQSAFILRFLPAVARAKDILDAGALGPILAFRGRMIHGGYLNPQRPMSWRLDQELAGGGALADLGIHIIDLVQFLLGDIAQVDARTRTYVTERPASAGSARRVRVKVDDWAEVRCVTALGVPGTVEASRIGDGMEETAIEIFGRDGSLQIRADAPEFPRWFDRRAGELRPSTRDLDGDTTRAVLSVWPPAKLSLGWFVNAHAASLAWCLRNVHAVRPGGTAAAPADSTRLTPGIGSSLQAQAVLDAAYRSAREGRPLGV
ncbi:MAG: Gfo/Idh/MocA family protein [Bacillota bacterium]